MRQSLSERQAPARAVTAAIALSVVLVVAALIDQIGGRSLAEHATAMYAPYGKAPSSGLLYGLLYTVAVVSALLWLVVLRPARRGGRSAPVLAVVMTVISAGLAVLLLATAEYGSAIFPPLWGLLALLPAIAGAVAAVLLFRRWR
jgi:hypothetical protein